MNKFKKVISVGMSATLLASLFTVIAAGSAMASITGTGAGSVAQGSTSAGTASYLFTENSIAALPNAAGSMTITITPAAPGAGTVEWVGPPVVTAPGSLGASASIAGNVLTISVAASDPANVETISITGLKVKASSTASPGAVVATLSTGLIGTAFSGGTVTASGKLAQAYGIGTTQFDVALDVGSCPFSGTNTVTVGGESVTVTGVTADTPVVGQYRFTNPGDPFVSNQLANAIVTQTVPNCSILSMPSPATVVQALAYSSHGNPTVFPGENNSDAAALDLVEPAAGFLAVGNVITYTIDTAGVVFSNVPPAASIFAGNIVLGAPVLSADRKSVTITVTTASSGASGIHLGGILYDVAATVPPGTFVSVTVTATGKIVKPTSNTNAVVFRGITASAPLPTVYIGENNQATGLITLKEGAAGFFQSGVGTNNVLTVCPIAVDYTFTFAPWARVVGGVAAGNLLLRDGATASATNVVMGSPSTVCTGGYQWTIWSSSTTASTIEIGNSTFSSGPLINVAVNQNPGLVAINIRNGDGTGFDDLLIATTGFATAAYRTSVGVAALSQTAIPAGALGALVGDLTVWETAQGQLKAGELICVEVLPRAFTAGGPIQDVFLGSQPTAGVPTVSTTGAGLVVGPVSFLSFQQEIQQCPGASGEGPNTQSTAFAFQVLQQSVAGDGRLVISNIRYTTTADAADGLVQVRVSGANLGSPTVVAFQQIVSNARIGGQPAATAATRLGVTQTGAFTTSTKVTTVNKYVTYRFDLGVAAAGKLIQIQGATKTGNDWSAFTATTSRVANASGVVYYYARSASVAWKSFRAWYSAGGVTTPARQSRWIP